MKAYKTAELRMSSIHKLKNQVSEQRLDNHVKSYCSGVTCQLGTEINGRRSLMTINSVTA